MRKPTKPAAEITVELANTLPKHPRHQDFLEGAIKLLADDVRNAATADMPVTEEEAMAGARAEFETGISALAFSADEDCFYVLWTSPQWTQMLRPYLVKAWEQEPGAYGSNPPVSHDPKPSNLH